MMKIIGYDVTGGWNIDEYSPQTGHVIRFVPDIDECKIRNIEWNLKTDISDRNVLNGEIFNTYSVETIFKVNGYPGQGYVFVKCKITLLNDKKLCSKIKILIVPVISCSIQIAEREPITNCTKEIKLQAEVICQQLQLGNPFNGNPLYACGGACLDTCPEYEVLVTPLEGTIIKSYGKHIISGQESIRGSTGANADCVPLYQNNYLGKHSKYPPLTSTICIVPNPNELNIVYEQQKEKLSIDGLSSYMFKNGYFAWKIEGEKIITKTKKLDYKFRDYKKYEVIVSIHIPCCETITISTIVDIR